MSTVDFTCNVCGTANAGVPREAFGREDPTCPACMSSVRMRSIIHHLSLGIFGVSLPISRFPERRDIVGLGLSDWLGYAPRLEERFSYTNTFYHQEPFLDIAAPPTGRFPPADFLISTDVFEHVPPPVERAFEGAAALLKPGGLLVLTVPFTDVPETVEHFPDLDRFAITRLGEDYILVNRDRAGALSVRENLVFHGGPGDTLEMRIFSRADTVAILERCGFTDVVVHGGEYPEFGILPPHHHGLPITARRKL